MVKRWIDTLSPKEIEKYRQRSSNAINGIQFLLQKANDISISRNIGDKYRIIAENIGLAQEGGNSYYNYFVPLNTDIVFLLRIGNHNNTNPMLFNSHEQLGRHNKRYIVYFKNGNVFGDKPNTFLEAEHHVIPYNINALDNEASVIAILNSIKKLLENGETVFQPLPIITENNQLKENTNMKKIVRLTESELKHIIKEGVKRTLNEYGGWTQDPMDWAVVNTSQDGRDIYKVGLWWGSGYALDIYLAWANSDEEALNYVVAYITNHHPENIESSNRDAEETIQWIMKEKACDREEAEEAPEFYESFMYVDATMEGATHACYIWSENLTIMKAPEEWKQKFLASEHNSNVSDNEMNESAARKTIRLTENELKHMIMESVKRVMNETRISKDERGGLI